MVNAIFKRKCNACERLVGLQLVITHPLKLCTNVQKCPSLLLTIDDFVMASEQSWYEGVNGNTQLTKEGTLATQSNLSGVHSPRH